MLLPDWAVLNAAIDWLGQGLWNLAWWQIILYTLATTHITIAAVTIFLHRAQLYRVDSMNLETMKKYSHGTPVDWMVRNVYTRYRWQGVGLMLIMNLALFGALGAAVWAVQMLWIPFWAAGVVNGVGHYWGYRNFEAQDASTNLSPWGIIIGGEELHNNHHTYPTSAKFSV